MKLRLLAAAAVLPMLFGAVLPACAKRSVSPTAEETHDTQRDPTETDPVSLSPPETGAPPETTLPPETTAPPETTEAAVLADDTLQPVLMDRAEALRLYTKAVNEVKLRCPGFTKRETQTVEDVSADAADEALVSGILAGVANELLLASGAEDRIARVDAHDDRAVRRMFPVYGQPYGCALEDPALIRQCTCYTDGKTLRLTLCLTPVDDPEPVSSDFGKIMDPLSRDGLAVSVFAYFGILSPDASRFSFRYTDPEITALIDCGTGRLLSLTQKTVIRMALDLTTGDAWLKTSFRTASGTVVSVSEYTDFDWS